MKKSKALMEAHKQLRIDLMSAIMEILLANDESLELYDNRGSLCYNVIDDQESEVIQSIEVARTPDNLKPPRLVVWVGVYEPDYSVDVDEFDCKMLLNVLEACERAIK